MQHIRQNKRLLYCENYHYMEYNACSLKYFITAWQDASSPYLCEDNFEANLWNLMLEIYQFGDIPSSILTIFEQGYYIIFVHILLHMLQPITTSTLS